MAEPHPQENLASPSFPDDFDLVEEVVYVNGGHSRFYLSRESDPSQNSAVIVDDGICAPAANEGSSIEYTQITCKQNEYMHRCGRVVRVLQEDISLANDFLGPEPDSAGEGNDAKATPSSADRANTADPSPLERKFEDHFTRVYGNDAIRFLQREFGITSADGSTRYLDYLVRTTHSRIAVEENGVSYHHPQLIGCERYRAQLMKQNSCSRTGIKLYRFSSEDCKFPERLEDDIRTFLGQDTSDFIDDGIVLSRQFKLYDHQQASLDDIAAQRSAGCKSFLIVFPTASGKSRIVEEDMARFARERGGLRALVLVPSTNIAADWEQRVARLPEDANIQAEVRCYQYLEFHLDEYQPDSFDYIVVDEAHHAVAPGLKRSIQYFDPAFLVGLTATDQRPDKLRLESVFGSYRVGLSLQEAMERGIVARTNVYRVQTNIDLSHVRINGHEYVNADLEKTVRVSSRNDLIVSVLKDYFCGGQMEQRQGVIFCVNTSHATEMERLLTAAGISARAYSSKSRNPQEIMQDFRNGKIRFLCACQMISEGWDYPELGILVMARPTLSRVLYLQQLGRGLRRTRAKSNVVVVDVVDDYGCAVMPCSMHSIFSNPYYVPFGDILRQNYQPGEMIQIDGLAERVERITEVDIFSFAEKYEGFLSSEQLARELFVSTGTVTSWVNKGRISPSASFQFGNKRLYLFDPASVPAIRTNLGLGEHNEQTILEDFLAFIEERDYALSYKMVFLPAFLRHMDDLGDARIDDVLNDYIAFYRQRIMAGLPVDRKTCPYTLETLEDRSFIKHSMLTNPFEKYERKRFMYHSRDLGVISLNHALRQQLTPDLIDRVLTQMQEDLDNYYRSLG